ncbi:MAG: SBBP repeat-containing protein [Bacteroidetes bacterium]|jgi:hypothetical protein|nr:SBBP repeat-containing protein [Bacteroidota bacterium]
MLLVWGFLPAIQLDGICGSPPQTTIKHGKRCQVDIPAKFAKNQFTTIMARLKPPVFFIIIRFSLMFILLVVSLMPRHSVAQQLAWAIHVGGIWDDGTNDMATDRDGNVYMAGQFENVADFDPSNNEYTLETSFTCDGFVCKLDSQGKLLWARQTGTTMAAEVKAIAVDDSSNVYITGYFMDTIRMTVGQNTKLLVAKIMDIFVCKLDAKGNFLWAKQLGASSYGNGLSIAANDSGYVYTIGYFKDTMDLGQISANHELISLGQTDVYICKLTARGQLVWAVQLGGASGDIGSSLDLDGAGNIYTTGYFKGKVDFNPSSKDEDTLYLTSLGMFDIFIAKFGSSGNMLWVKQIGGADYDIANKIALDRLNNLFVTGSFGGVADFDPGVGQIDLWANGEKDAFVVKLDSGGNLLWVRQMGGLGKTCGMSIAVQGLGNVYTTGYFAGQVDFDPGKGTHVLCSVVGGEDVFINMLDSNGNFVWATAIGGYDTDVGSSITLDGLDNVYSAGYYNEFADFDPDTGVFVMTAAGWNDAFLLKLKGRNTGILENTLKNALTFYPNPTSGELTIDFGNRLLDGTATLRNALGQVVLKTPFSGIHMLQIKIPDGTGLFIVEINANGQRAIARVIKE